MRLVNLRSITIFGSRQMTAKVSDFRLFLLGKELEPVKAARDLGVTLDSNLTYNEHIVSTNNNNNNNKVFIHQEIKIHIFCYK